MHPESILEHTEIVDCENSVLSDCFIAEHAFKPQVVESQRTWSTVFLLTLYALQAISQGIWAMARLGFKPSSHLLKTLASDVLYQIDKGNPMHRQAVANVFWSLAALDFPMNNTFYKQIMQTIMAHAYRFRNVHFGQVATQKTSSLYTIQLL